MPTSCVFQLDRLNAVYNSGEYISGRIVLTTTRIKRVNAIYVTLEGEARVQWSISSKTETANYYGQQQYLFTRINVYDSYAKLGAGTHVYLLMLRIPPVCPSTCKGPFGYIAYGITLTIEKPWSFDENFRQPITVVQCLNLNSNPEYALPVKDENIKYLCNWPCTSGPICSTLVIPYSGFASDQEIPFFLEVDNQSQYDILSVSASLKQHFVFLARNPLKRNYSAKTIAKSCISEPTLRVTKRIYQGSVSVPPNTPRSTLNPNFIVFLHYTLRLKLKTGYFHYDTDISVPVVIGTVPLRCASRQSQTLSVLQVHRNNNGSNQGPVTRQPSLTNSRWRLNQRVIRGAAAANLNSFIAEEVEEEEGEENADGADLSADTDADSEPRREIADDDPPTYDSCLPPSFSFATLDSQPEPYSSAANQEHQRLFVNLPKFPAYNTFTASAQALNGSLDHMHLLGNRFHSHASLDTDATGRSLATFASSGDILSEDDEVNEDNL